MSSSCVTITLSFYTCMRPYSALLDDEVSQRPAVGDPGALSGCRAGGVGRGVGGVVYV